MKQETEKKIIRYTSIFFKTIYYLTGLFFFICGLSIVVTFGLIFIAAYATEKEREAKSTCTYVNGRCYRPERSPSGPRNPNRGYRHPTVAQHDYRTR